MPPEHVHRCEDLTPEELDFVRAIDRYKVSQRRPFPTWREVLAIVRSLGYRRVAEPMDLPEFKPGLKHYGRY